MLRDFTLLALVICSGALFFASLPAAAVLLVLVAIFSYFSKRSYWHVLDKELNYLASKLIRVVVVILALSIGLVFTSSFGIKDVAPFFAIGCIASLPILLPFAFTEKVSKSSSMLGQFRSIRILRCLLVASFAELILVIIGLVGKFYYHLLPAITPAQLIGIELLILLPIRSLQYDKNPHKPLKVSDRNMRTYTLGQKALKQYLSYGLFTTILVYANYLFLFVRHNLSPTHLDSSLPLYKQSTSLVMASLVVCLALHILFERVDKHDFFINEHTLENKKLIRAFGLGFIGLLVIVYAPGIQSIFSTQPLSIYDWLCVILVAVLYSSGRMVHRHTRKHSRRAVLKLHQQIHP